MENLEKSWKILKSQKFWKSHGNVLYSHVHLSQIWNNKYVFERNTQYLSRHTLSYWRRDLFLLFRVASERTVSGKFAGHSNSSSGSCRDILLPENCRFNHVGYSVWLQHIRHLNMGEETLRSRAKGSRRHSAERAELLELAELHLHHHLAHNSEGNYHAEQRASFSPVTNRRR